MLLKFVIFAKRCNFKGARNIQIITSFVDVCRVKCNMSLKLVVPLSFLTSVVCYHSGFLVDQILQVIWGFNWDYSFRIIHRQRQKLFSIAAYLQSNTMKQDFPIPIAKKYVLLKIKLKVLQTDACRQFKVLNFLDFRILLKFEENMGSIFCREFKNPHFSYFIVALNKIKINFFLQKFRNRDPLLEMAGFKNTLLLFFYAVIEKVLTYFLLQYQFY
jgi:hypothetical protein